jgi:hypothetical protein
MLSTALETEREKALVLVLRGLRACTWGGRLELDVPPALPWLTAFVLAQVFGAGTALRAGYFSGEELLTAQECLLLFYEGHYEEEHGRWSLGNTVSEREGTTGVCAGEYAGEYLWWYLLYYLQNNYY